jgi:hypothetical protein
VKQLKDNADPVTEQQLMQLLTHIFSEFSPFATFFFTDVVNAIGPGNAATMSILGATDPEANCDCPGQLPTIPVSYDWSHIYDFRASLHGWTDLDQMWVEGYGLYNADVMRYDNMGWIEKHFADLASGGTLRFVAINVANWPTNVGGGGVGPWWIGDGSGEVWFDEKYLNAAWLTTVLSEDYGTSGVWSFMKYQNTNGPDHQGISQWYRLILAGVGTDPFPDDP